MNKKIFVLLLATLFLIASVGFISAEDSDDDSNGDVVETSSNLKNISVKKVWNDSGFENERPDFVQVELYVDGKLVDKVTLNESNHWKTTFKDVDVSGNVKVVEVNPTSDYNVSYKGNVDEGFVITSKIVKTADDKVLGANNDSNKLEGNVSISEKQNGTDDNNTNNSKEVTDKNKTINKTSNNTINKTNNKTDNKTVNKTGNNAVNKTISSVVNKTINKTDNKTINKTKVDNKIINKTVIIHNEKIT